MEWIEWIATFYSHFGAVRFQRACRSLGLPSRMMPVPRALSSSCGTCVSLRIDPEKVSEERCAEAFLEKLRREDPGLELEQLVAAEGKGYQLLYRAEDS